MEPKNTQAVDRIIECYKRAVIEPRLGDGTLAKELLGALEQILLHEPEIPQFRPNDDKRCCDEAIMQQHGDIGESAKSYYIGYDSATKLYHYQLTKISYPGEILGWLLANPGKPLSREQADKITGGGTTLQVSRLNYILKLSDQFRLKTNCAKEGRAGSWNPIASYTLVKVR